MAISAKDLLNQGFVILKYPKELRRSVEEVALIWKSFCALPDEVKNLIPYSSENVGAGYEAHKRDPKEIFDITLGYLDWLQLQLATINHPLIQKFVEHASKLIQLLQPLAGTYAQAMEKELGLQGLEKEIKESLMECCVRFIHYFPGSAVGSEIAKSHIDQSFAALHIFESDSGLQYLDPYECKWKPIPIEHGKTVIMPAIQTQYITECKVIALCHRVVGTKRSHELGRYSVVMFFRLKNRPQYNKACFGPLQNRPIGFNYELPFEELQRFFTEVPE